MSTETIPEAETPAEPTVHDYKSLADATSNLHYYQSILAQETVKRDNAQHEVDTYTEAVENQKALVLERLQVVGLTGGQA